MDIDEALDDEHFISISLAGWQAIMGPGRGARADSHRTTDNRHETSDPPCACCESVSFSPPKGKCFHWWLLPPPVENIHFRVTIMIKLFVFSFFFSEKSHLFRCYLFFVCFFIYLVFVYASSCC